MARLLLCLLALGCEGPDCGRPPPQYHGALCTSCKLLRDELIEAVPDDQELPLQIAIGAQPVIHASRLYARSEAGWRDLEVPVDDAHAQLAAHGGEVELVSANVGGWNLVHQHFDGQRWSREVLFQTVTSKNAVGGLVFDGCLVAAPLVDEVVRVGVHGSDWQWRTLLPWEAKASTPALAFDSRGELQMLLYLGDELKWGKTFGALESVPRASWGEFAVAGDRPYLLWKDVDGIVLSVRDGNWSETRITPADVAERTGDCSPQKGDGLLSCTMHDVTYADIAVLAGDRDARALYVKTDQTDVWQFDCSSFCETTLFGRDVKGSLEMAWVEGGVVQTTTLVDGAVLAADAKLDAAGVIHVAITEWQEGKKQIRYLAFSP